MNARIHELHTNGKVIEIHKKLVNKENREKNDTCEILRHVYVYQDELPNEKMILAKVDKTMDLFIDKHNFSLLKQTY